MPKKAHEMENLSAKERWNTKQNFHLSWSFLLPNLQSGVLCLLSLQQAQSYHNSSNHLLGNPRYTLTERLLVNLTNWRFLFQMASVWPIKMALNLFNLALMHLSTCQIQRLCCLAFLTSSRPSLSHAKMHYKSHTMVMVLYIWKIIMWYPRNF